MKEVKREILLGFWKVHILHHAGQEPLHGQWMLNELREHGYDISPGTLYPLLRRMERLGWLKCATPRGGGLRARRNYRLTTEGADVLALVRVQLQELCDEVLPKRPARRAASILPTPRKRRTYRRAGASPSGGE